jgi:hypothetical protein
MKKQGKMPITGGKTAMKPKPPVLTDANTPSSDAERMIKRPPMPFQSKQAIANLPVHAQKESRGTDFTGPGKSARGTAMGGAKGLPPGGPVGQKRPIDNSKQIGGNKGWPPPKRKAGPQNLGKSRRHASFYGE